VFTGVYVHLQILFARQARQANHEGLQANPSCRHDVGVSVSNESVSNVVRVRSRRVNMWDEENIKQNGVNKIRASKLILSKRFCGDIVIN